MTVHTVAVFQPRPQGLLFVQNGGRRNPWPRLPKLLQKFVRILFRKHDEMSSFRLNNGFQLQKTNRAAIRWKQPPKKPFHRVSRDKILHDSWSISAALARVFSDRHFERGEGPGDEVGSVFLMKKSKYNLIAELRAAKPRLRSTMGKKKWLSIKPRNFGSDVIVT